MHSVPYANTHSHSHHSAHGMYNHSLNQTQSPGVYHHFDHSHSSISEASSRSHSSSLTRSDSEAGDGVDEDHDSNLSRDSLINLHHDHDHTNDDIEEEDDDEDDDNHHATSDYRHRQRNYHHHHIDHHDDGTPHNSHKLGAPINIMHDHSHHSSRSTPDDANTSPLSSSIPISIPIQSGSHRGSKGPHRSSSSHRSSVGRFSLNGSLLRADPHTPTGGRVPGTGKKNSYSSRGSNEDLLIKPGSTPSMSGSFVLVEEFLNSPSTPLTHMHSMHSFASRSSNAHRSYAHTRSFHSPLTSKAGFNVASPSPPLHQGPRHSGRDGGGDVNGDHGDHDHHLRGGPHDTEKSAKQINGGTEGQTEGHQTEEKLRKASVLSDHRMSGVVIGYSRSLLPSDHI